MHPSRIALVALAVLQSACATAQLARRDPVAPKAPPAQLEVMVAAADGEVLDWGLWIDGERTEPKRTRSGVWRLWNGEIASGAKTIQIEVQYRTDAGRTGTLREKMTLQVAAGSAQQIDAVVKQGRREDRLSLVASDLAAKVDIAGADAWPVAVPDDPCKRGDQELCLIKGFSQMLPANPVSVAQLSE